MGYLCQGSIVWANIPDKFGKNPKQRPLIILTRTDEIASAELLVAMAGSASSALRDPLPESYVDLPFQPQGKVRTKLRKRTVAICDWIATIRPDQILEIGGHVPADLLEYLISKSPVASLFSLGQKQQAKVRPEDSSSREPPATQS